MTLSCTSDPMGAIAIGSLKAPGKQTQHCWPTTPNIGGCYILRPIAHSVIVCCCVLLGVVAAVFTPL